MRPDAQQQQNGQGIGDRCAQCWNTIPFISKSLIYVAIFSAVFGIFLRDPCENLPEYTVFKIQIWRFFTNLFVSSGIFTGLFAVMWIATSCRILETRLGSMYTLHALGTVYFLGNIIFLAIFTPLILIPGSVGNYLKNEAMSGMWSLIFGIMAAESMSNPLPTRQFCCLPVQVPTKLYPFLLVLIFQFFGHRLSLFCSLAAGYLYGYGPANLQPSDDRLRALERGRLSFIASKRSFISVEARGAEPVWNPFTQQGDGENREGDQNSGGFLPSWNNSSDAPTSSNRQGFSGRGYTLGTGEEVGESGGVGAFFGTASQSETPQPVEMKKTAVSNERLQEQRRVLAERLESRLRMQKESDAKPVDEELGE